MSATLPSPELHYPSGHHGVVRLHPNLVFAKQRWLGVMAKRILALVFDQISPDDQHLQPYYQVRVAAITRITGQQRSNAYADVEEAVRELADVAWRMQRTGSEAWEIRHLLDSTREQAIGYARGVVTLCLNPQLGEYFLMPAVYIEFSVAQYLRLTSWYSMRLYELLTACREVGEWTVSMEEYRRLMDCELTDARGRPVTRQTTRFRGKYPRVCDLLLHTVTRPLAELAATDLVVDYAPRHAPGSGRGRRRIHELHFAVKRP